MKNLNSLKIQVAVKFLIVILILSILLLIFLPLGLKKFFIEESYRTIEQSQINPSMPMNHQGSVNPKTVNHMILTYENNNYILMNRMRYVNQEFLEEAIDNIKNQDVLSKRYEYQDDHVTIYYVINISDDFIFVSFVHATYVDYYIDTLFQQLLFIILIVVVLAIIISIFFANSITHPLIRISHKIKKMSKDNWDDEVLITRKDEIGDIEIALESMRQHLKKQDSLQREMFQNISHDLKTPIMIIEGYSQSIIDGYVNPDEIQDVSQSILEEAKRLENKVKSLLYINKIEQMYLEKKVLKTIACDELINTVILPFKKQWTHIHFKLEMKEPFEIKGEFEEWRVALENIIENMTRYSKSFIKIEVTSKMIKISNDGSHIEKDIMEGLFIPYGVGLKSKSGLGLAITHKVLTMYGYKINAFNIDSGVEFRIKKSHE